MRVYYCCCCLLHYRLIPETFRYTLVTEVLTWELDDSMHPGVWDEGWRNEAAPSSSQLVSISPVSTHIRTWPVTSLTTFLRPSIKVTLNICWNVWITWQKMGLETESWSHVLDTSHRNFRTRIQETYYVWMFHLNGEVIIHRIHLLKTLQVKRANLQMSYSTPTPMPFSPTPFTSP
jgi:hypothetical protein